MPGKKGFGDTRKTSSESPVYKKQAYGTAKSPFKQVVPPGYVKKKLKKLKSYGGAKTIVGGLKNIIVDSHKRLYNMSGIVINPTSKNPKGKLKLSTDKE